MDEDKEYFWQYKDLKKRIAVILSDYRKNVDYYYLSRAVLNCRFMAV